MKKHILTIMATLYLLAPHHAMAQTAPIYYGDIKAEEINLNQYSPDSTAPAVMLCSYARTYFSFEGASIKLYYEAIFRIKILKKEGYSYANVEIPYYQNKRKRLKITTLKAHAYNMENGELVETKVEKEDIFDQKLDKNHFLKKFTIPKVKEGTIIEYAYSIKSDYAFDLPGWEFQKKIPVLYSEYRLAIPEFMKIEFLPQCLSANTKPDTLPWNTFYELGIYSSRLLKWVQKNIPKIEDEPYIGTTDSYLSRIDFLLREISFADQHSINYIYSWYQMSVDFWDEESFGKVIQNKKGIDKIVDRITTGITDEQEKMKSIYSYVRDNFRSDDYYGSPIMRQPVKEILETKKGTPAELNLIMLSMLNYAGLNAFPVLISNRSHGKIIEKFPIVERFDHVIACVVIGTDTTMLDANDPLRPLGLLSEEAMNGKGVLLKDEGYQILNVKNVLSSAYDVKAVIDVHPDGSIDEQLKISHQGYPALEERHGLQTDKFETRLSALLKEEMLEGKLLSSGAENVNDPDLPLIYNCTLNSKSFLQTNDSGFLLSPFLSLGHINNPFNAETRKFPVDFGFGWDENYDITIKIPVGYTFTEIPKAQSVQWEDGSLTFKYNIESDHQQIRLKSYFSNTNPFFQVEDYARLRAFFAQMSDALSEQVIFKKQ